MYIKALKLTINNNLKNHNKIMKTMFNKKDNIIIVSTFLLEISYKPKNFLLKNLMNLSQIDEQFIRFKLNIYLNKTTMKLKS